MIVPMKKAVLIMQAKSASGTLKSLRSLGIIHLQHIQAPKGKEICLIQEDLSLANQALEILSKSSFSYGCEASLSLKDIKKVIDWKTTASYIIDTWKRLDQLQEFSRHLGLKIREWLPWGDFNLDAIGTLSQKNIYLRLFQAPVKELKDFPEDSLVKVIFTKNNIAFCAVFSCRRFECAFKEIELPKMSLRQMQERLIEDQRIIEELRNNLRTFFSYRMKFLAVKKSLEKELEFEEALVSMGEAKTLSYLGGFVPFDAQERLMSFAKKERLGIFITEPGEDEPVPTLIRNPAWVSVISPLFKILEIVPGYRELDISVFFLVFFSLFFGILIGDAGYGLVYLLITFLAHKKLGKKLADKKAFFLFYILSFCAIIWGLLTSSFFGQSWLLNLGFKPLAPALGDIRNIQAFCFFLGALHLTIAHLIRVVLKAPALTALADLGWVFVLWAAFFFAKLLILSEALAFYALWLLIAGATLVVFFTNPQKNVLKTAAEGLGTLALSLMNNFTDVVSYLRLFAVGLAGQAMADTFNSMALGIGSSNLLAIIFNVFIIIGGHALNLVLGPMSVLVHGVRLNVLEFSAHANIAWSGIAYKPFKE